jgi:hypothetical protein
MFTSYLISPYANFAIDTLVLDYELAEGAVWELGFEGFLLPEVMGKIRHLAIVDDLWRDLDPDMNEHVDPDPRLTIQDLSGLETLSLIVGVWKGEPWEVDDDDESVDEEGDLEKRRLVQTDAMRDYDDRLLCDASNFLTDIEEARPGWDAPAIQLVNKVSY